MSWYFPPLLSYAWSYSCFSFYTDYIVTLLKVLCRLCVACGARPTRPEKLQSDHSPLEDSSTTTTVIHTHHHIRSHARAQHYYEKMRCTGPG